MLCVCDPASYEPRSFIRISDFDAARRSFGTDEDLLLISLAEQQQTSEAQQQQQQQPEVHLQ
eukprot:SAG11_NODE_24571_length_371_cov_1.136029_1_plen_61_part_01